MTLINKTCKLSSRQGIIKVSKALLEDDPQAVSKLFSLVEFVPIRVECSGEPVVTYVGYSPGFRKTTPGAHVPTYTITAYSSHGLCTGCKLTVAEG